MLAHGAGLADGVGGPGSITQLSVIDTLAYGSLPADTIDLLVKQGIDLTATSFTLAPPATSNQSINYLIQAALLENDTNPVVLPYYNAANPAQPYSGPNNSGVAQNTWRVQRVQLQVKAGAAAISGSQATPPIDNGWVGLYVVTVRTVRRRSVRQVLRNWPPRRFSTGSSRRCALASHRQCRRSSPTAPLPCRPVSPRRKSRFGVAVQEATPRSAAFRAVAGPVGVCPQTRHRTDYGSDDRGHHRKWRHWWQHRRITVRERRNVQLRPLCQRDGWQPERARQRGIPRTAQHQAAMV